MATESYTTSGDVTQTDLAESNDRAAPEGANG